MKVTTGGKPRKQMTKDEQIDDLKKLSRFFELENRKLREQVKNLTIPVVINWVACSERLPEGALGSYIACLENNTVHKLQYSDMTKHWWDIAMGDIKPQNPVKYWAELPEPPCL